VSRGGSHESGEYETHRPWLALALLLALADQASKAAISSSLRFGEVREIAPFFNLVLAHNRGAAFSFLADAAAGKGRCSSGSRLQRPPRSFSSLPGIRASGFSPRDSP